MEVSFQLAATITAAAGVIYAAHSSKDFLLTQKRILTGTFQDYFYPDEYKKQMSQYVRFAQKIEKENGAKFCYPTGLLQALLHRTYGYSFAEIMIIQKVIDWYLPRVKEKFYPKDIEKYLIPLQGQSFFEPIMEKDHICEDDLSNIHDMFTLFVNALESRYSDIAILPERSPSDAFNQISEMLNFEQQCIETRSQRSPSKSSGNDDTQSLIGTECSEGVSDDEHVLQHIEPLEMQRQMWYEMSSYHLSQLAEKSSVLPRKPFHVMVIAELETTLSMSFINKLISRLQDLSQNALMFKLIIGVTYETPEQFEKRVLDLKDYLSQMIVQKFDEHSKFCAVCAERVLPISFIDMTASENSIRTAFSEEFQADPCEQLVLILNPEQASFQDHIKKMTALETLVSFLPRGVEEGLHPEHWLQALRQTFRLRDEATRKQWSEYVAGQKDTIFSMTTGFQHNVLKNAARINLYETLSTIDQSIGSPGPNIFQYLYQTGVSILGEKAEPEFIEQNKGPDTEQQKPFSRKDSDNSLSSDHSGSNSDEYCVVSLDFDPKLENAPVLMSQESYGENLTNRLKCD